MGSNAYEFDFLRTEHILDKDGQFDASPSTTLHVNTSFIHAYESGHSVAYKRPDLEKQFDVIQFLRQNRSAGCLPPSVIYKATGIDLEDTDKTVAKMLQTNVKIRVEQVPDPKNPSIMIDTYAYQTKYNHVRDQKSLLSHINLWKDGVSMRDLLDAYYDGIKDDLANLITAGEILAVNTEDKDKILFPRGDVFLVELDGIVTTVGGAIHSTTKSGEEVFAIQSDVDPTKQIRRGEAVNVGGQWFRVSSAVKDAPLSNQPVRAQAPLSVVSLTDPDKRNEKDGYIRPFDPKSLPLDAALSSAAFDNIQKSKQARERFRNLGAHGQITSGCIAAQLMSSNAHPSTSVRPFSRAASGNASTRKRHTTYKTKVCRRPEPYAEDAATNPSLSRYSHARRHGCTKDIREIYLATRSIIPHEDSELHKLLLERNLLESGKVIRRTRLNKEDNADTDVGKFKKRKHGSKNQQLKTNAHSESTEIGEVLRRAMMES